MAGREDCDNSLYRDGLHGRPSIDQERRLMIDHDLSMSMNKVNDGTYRPCRSNQSLNTDSCTAGYLKRHRS